MKAYAKVADGVADNVLSQKVVYRFVAIEFKSPQFVVYAAKGEGAKVRRHSYRCVSDMT